MKNGVINGTAYIGTGNIDKSGVSAISGVSPVIGVSPASGVAPTGAFDGTAY